MNREIKFRFWEPYQKRMFVLQLGLNHFDDVSDINIINNYCMQFTGLKDKNGTEIYEGDIVKSYQNKLFNILYDNDRGKFRLKDTVQDLDFILENILGEVIGNIYENPELLEEK